MARSRTAIWRRRKGPAPDNGRADDPDGRRAEPPGPVSRERRPQAALAQSQHDTAKLPRQFGKLVMKSRQQVELGPVNGNCAETPLGRFPPFLDKHAKGGFKESPRLPVGRKALAQRRGRFQCPEKPVGQEQRLCRGLAGAKLLRALVELLDLGCAATLQQTSEIGNPLEPEPGARSAVDREIGEQLTVLERLEANSRAD